MQNLHYSVNQCFSNDQFTGLQNHAWVKYPFQVQHSLMDISIESPKNPLTRV